MAQLLDQAGYAKLTQDLRGIIEQAKNDVRRSVNSYMVKMYWDIGQRILQEDLIANAGYGDSIINQIAGELAIAPRTIRYAVDFAELYPSFPASESLSWSHYRELTHIHDDDARAWYEEQAVESKLNVRDLVDGIRSNAYEESRESSRGSESNVAPLKRPKDPSYIYQCVVERVVDGDTILVRIDLGFDVWKEQRLRLAHVDTEAVDTPDGQKAFDYVRQQLALHPNVTIKTNKIDVYGRYIADLFYSHEDQSRGQIFNQGRYLNQELLDLGLANYSHG